ncbi:hypothetical protein B0H66DRAFT_576809 [Apodospora peruviana]|uniref:Short-chain dehydrogenase/reductase family protein n=1 Tax=Apodospora peruviana TaxID=516989 RepID=A0AAE0HY06_9PEZI|nr:hypothetical protein B0H66DRAFT_576809 [Apodospora peruviana]
MRLEHGPARLFIQTQFCVKPKPIPLTSETDLTGKTAVVTGGNSGLGLHHARQLLGLNLSRLILAVRSPEKGESAAVKFRAEFPSAVVSVWSLEMTSYPSIQAFARRVATETPDLDIAVLNAGVMQSEFALNPSTGHERDIQVNYLSTFLLAILLMPTLRRKVETQNDKSRKGPGRLTIIGSGVAYMARLPNSAKRPFLKSFDDLSVQPWDMMERYSASKALHLLFLARLFEHLPPADELIFNVVDPGYCEGSGLHQHMRGAISVAFSVLATLTARSLEAGAATYTDAVVVQGKESHGCFVKDLKIAPFCALVYTPEGEKLMDVLFEETMAEFEFAGAREILQSMRS